MMGVILQSFGGLSQGQLQFIALIMLGLFYAGIAIRSVATIVVVSLNMITLIGVFELGLPFSYFWLMLVASLIMLGVSMLEFTS